MHSRKRTARGRSTASRESGPPSGHEMDSPSLPLADDAALLSSTRDRRLAAWLGAAALLAFVVAIGTLLYYAQFSGSIQWALGVAFLAVIAVFGCVLLLRRTGEPAPLIRPAPPGAVREGDLEA